MSLAPAPAPGFVKLSTIIARVLEKSYTSLILLVESCVISRPISRARFCVAKRALIFSLPFSAGEKTDKERKQLLYEWFLRTRASFVRLLVLLRWARTVPAINNCRV